MTEILSNKSGDILPFKTLSNMPDWCVIPERTNRVRIIDIGSLSNLKKFMNNGVNFNNCPSQNIDTSGWAGSDTFEEYLELLENGDEQVIKLIRDTTKASIKEFETKYKEVLTNYRFDVTGQFFDVGLVLTGVPETWLEPEPESEEVLRIEINIDGGFRCDGEFEIIQKNGGRLCGMIAILENHGIEVKVRITNGVERWGENRSREMLVTSFVVKDYDEPINYKKLSSVLSPTYVRRGAFKIRETLSGGASEVGASMILANHVKLSESSSINELEEKLFKQGV